MTRVVGSPAFLRPLNFVAQPLDQKRDHEILWLRPSTRCRPGGIIGEAGGEQLLVAHGEFWTAVSRLADWSGCGDLHRLQPSQAALAMAYPASAPKGRCRFPP